MDQLHVQSSVTSLIVYNRKSVFGILPSFWRTIRGVIKKFLDWCREINTYQAIPTDFIGDIKQQMFYQLWKFKLDTLIIILLSNTFHMVWSPGAVSVEFRDLPQRNCFPMVLSIFKYTTLQDMVKYTVVKYQLEAKDFS